MKHIKQSTFRKRISNTVQRPWTLALQVLIFCMIVLRPMPAMADDSEHYIMDATGGLQVGWVLQKQTVILLDDPQLIKMTFDQGWGHLRSTWGERFAQIIDKLGDQEMASITMDWATIDRTRLGVMSVDHGASLKYVLSDNKIWLTMHPSWSKWELEYLVKFDIEIVVTVQVADTGDRIVVTDATIRVTNTTLEGTNLLSQVIYQGAKSLIDNTVEERMQKIGTSLAPARSEIQAMVKPISDLFGSIPNNAIYFDIHVDSDSGAISLCFKSELRATCDFRTR